MNDNTNRGLASQIVGCLTSPRRTLQEILEKPNLKKATMIILLIAIMAGWASYNYTGKLPFTPELLPGGGTLPRGPFGGMFRSGAGGAGQSNPQFPMQIRPILSTIVGIVGILGSWLISSILFHLISKTQGGNGEFKNMLTLAGYASTPLLIQQLLRLVDSFLITEDVITQFAQGLQLFASPFPNAVLNSAMKTLNIFKIWSIILMIIAIKKNYKISTSRSVIVSVGAYVILIFVSIVLPI